MPKNQDYLKKAIALLRFIQNDLNTTLCPEARDAIDDFLSELEGLKP